MYMAKKERPEPEFDVEEEAPIEKPKCRCTSESIGTCHY